MAIKKSLFANYNSVKEDIRYVKTYKGESLERKECVFIESEQTYAKIDDDKVIKDYYTEKFEFKDKCNKIINKFDINNLPTYDSCVYSKRPDKFCTVFDKNLSSYSIVFEAIPLDVYTEDLTTGYFYNNEVPKNKYIKETVIYRKVKNAYSSPTGNLKKDYLMGLKSPSYNITEGKRFKFGIELETIYGRLPDYLDNYLNYNAVHDGSLRGPNGEDPIGGEYVTGVLTGDTGFLQTKRLAVEVTKRCKIDKKCGMHLHLSGIDFSKENLIAIYKVYFTLENQIFSLLPKSRYRNTYCRRLSKIPSCLVNLGETELNSQYKYNLFLENAYFNLFNFVSSDNIPSYKVNKKTEHPYGFKCGYKHQSARYCWLNFVTAVFDTRHNIDAKTIEIRNHSATTNYRKIKNWTLIHMGILWYIENYKKDIFKGYILNLEEIMILAYPKSSSNIIKYINERVSLFSTPTSDSEHMLAELNDFEETNEDELLTMKGAILCV